MGQMIPSVFKDGTKDPIPMGQMIPWHGTKDPIRQNDARKMGQKIPF
jgi:hypothetical protein